VASAFTLRHQLGPIRIPTALDHPTRQLYNGGSLRNETNEPPCYRCVCGTVNVRSNSWWSTSHQRSHRKVIYINNTSFYRDLVWFPKCTTSMPFMVRSLSRFLSLSLSLSLSLPLCAVLSFIYRIAVGISWIPISSENRRTAPHRTARDGQSASGNPMRLILRPLTKGAKPSTTRLPRWLAAVCSVQRSRWTVDQQAISLQMDQPESCGGGWRWLLIRPLRASTQLLRSPP